MMRTILLPSLLALSTIVTARELHVVVRTSDRIVVKYICEDRANESGALATRTIVQAAGRLSWHGVGGVPPYTVLATEFDPVGNACITLVDATGMMATGCGIMIERIHVIPVHCEPDPGGLDSCAVKMPVNHSTSTAIYLPKSAPDPRPDRPNKEVDRERNPEPRPWREARHIDRDLRDPSPRPSPRPTADHERGSGREIARDVAPSVDRGINSGGSGSRSGGTTSSPGSRGSIYERYSGTGR